MEAVRSAVEQTIPPLEILICDDGSTDDSASRIASEFSTCNVPVHFDSYAHAGLPAVMRNHGLRKARGQWVAFLDSDDRWHPHKTQAMMEVINAHEDVAILGSNAHLLKNNEMQSQPCFSDNHARGVISMTEMLAENRMITSSVMVRKHLLLEAGGFPEHPSFKAIEDYAAWLTVFCRSSGYYIPEPLVVYRDAPTQGIRATQTTKGHYEGMLAIADRIDAVIQTDTSSSTNNQRAVAQFRMRYLRAMAKEALLTCDVGLALRTFSHIVRAGFAHAGGSS